MATEWAGSSGRMMRTQGREDNGDLEVHEDG